MEILSTVTILNEMNCKQDILQYISFLSRLSAFATLYVCMTERETMWGAESQNFPQVKRSEKNKLELQRVSQEKI